VSAIDALLDALADPHAPTTVHSRDQARNVHVADSLAGLPYVNGPRVADLGAGAGLPGLVLADADPSLQVTLVESSGRKADFIRATAERMGLTNVDVVTARAEEWPEGIGEFDTVTARALALLPVLCEYAAPLLRPGGRLVCWKGAVDEAEARDGRHAAAVLGLSEPEVVPVTPFRGSRSRTLWLFDKVTETPVGYPRRPGIATKRPLSAKSS
jgi:16S rRNA (guanine527-N7)-methyltransferase